MRLDCPAVKSIPKKTVHMRLDYMVTNLGSLRAPHLHQP